MIYSLQAQRGTKRVNICLQRKSDATSFRTLKGLMVSEGRSKTSGEARAPGRGCLCLPVRSVFFPAINTAGERRERRAPHRLQLNAGNRFMCWWKPKAPLVPAGRPRARSRWPWAVPDTPCGGLHGNNRCGEAVVPTEPALRSRLMEVAAYLGTKNEGRNVSLHWAGVAWGGYC